MDDQLKDLPPPETATERGKRRAAFRFEIMGIAVAMFILLVLFRGALEDAIRTSIVGFGTTVFLACLGYAGGLRGIDEWGRNHRTRSHYSEEGGFD